MEDKNTENRESGNEKIDSDFITEKIKQRPINKKKLLRRTLITAVMAVLFALVACLTFLILEPVISNWLYPEKEPAPIELPAETEEMLPEDMPADDSEISKTQATEEIQLHEEQLAEMVKDIRLDLKDYEDMYYSIAEISNEAAKSVVTVTASVSNVNWFNDSYESKDQTSGVIVAERENELFILVNYTALEEADSIVVTFFDGEQAQAKMRKKDVNTKLAVISVESHNLKPETMATATAADLRGSSGNLSLLGSPVIAIGSPIGTSGSVCYGVVTSNSTVLSMTDACYKLLTTDIYGSKNASGILINFSGQLIGILDNAYNSSDMENLVSAIGITELRKVIERLSNEKDQALLGTHGTDVTADANIRLGVPFGAYITEIDMDSPAMAAGIQSGDIIMGIEENQIKIYQDLVTALMNVRPDDTVTITLMRQGPDEYIEMEVEVALRNFE